MSDIAALQRLLLADAALTGRLAPAEDAAQLAAELARLAGERGLDLGEAEIAQALDTPSQLLVDRVPPAGWRPTEIVSNGETTAIEWLHFAGAPLTEGFYEHSCARARERPINALARVLTPLGALRECAAPRLAGLVLHMSRCGSTLVGQMLGAPGSYLAIREPIVLDTVIHFAARGQLPAEAVGWVAAALARDAQGPCTIKLDAWHTLALPLLRKAFPGTPWVFLHRDPAAVLASHRREPGLHVIPGVIPLDGFGVADAGEVAAQDYPAWVLERICGAALAAASDPLALFVDYADLPAAVEARILPHFGIAPEPADLAAMRAAAGRDAKRPEAAYTSGGAAAEPEVRAAMSESLAAAYAALAARARSGPKRMVTAETGASVGYDW